VKRKKDPPTRTDRPSKRGDRDEKKTELDFVERACGGTRAAIVGAVATPPRNLHEAEKVKVSKEESGGKKDCGSGKEKGSWSGYGKRENGHEGREGRLHPGEKGGKKKPIRKNV